VQGLTLEQAAAKMRAPKGEDQTRDHTQGPRRTYRGLDHSRGDPDGSGPRFQAGGPFWTDAEWKAL
jgi:hypothetical protein